MPLASATSGTMQPPQAEQSPAAPSLKPKTPGEHHRTFIPIIIIILVLLAALAIAVVTLGGGNRTGETTAVPAASVAPGPVLIFASKTFNYSIGVPNGWTRFEVSEYKKALLEAGNLGLAQAERKSLTEYFSGGDVMFRDDKSTSVFKPKFLVTAVPSSTVDRETARIKGVVGSIYTQVQYPEDKAVTFQNLPAHSLVATGSIGQNQVHERQIVLERSGTVYTIALMALEADWNNDLDSLFSDIANSFSI